ncbi:ferric reductase-like protein transmembrane component 4 [Mariannaea sp. PMI_226]|nr:ferric reductase-like protein transmembrane component 4 [Mariannaea sp. PMI_226]
MKKLQTGHGFVGYGIDAYSPTCAFACRDAISGATLNCSTKESGTMDGMDGMDDMGMSGEVMTDPECYATDDAFLQTLAWCISTRCNDTSVWKLERYWKANAVGSDDVQPDPKEPYQFALQKVHGTPVAIYAETGVLNETSVVAYDLWYQNYHTDVIFWGQERKQEKYGLVIFLSGVILPIAFSLLRFVPFPTVWRSKFNAWIIDPPLIGSKHDAPSFFGLVHVPKRGQALFIFYFIVINVVLSAVNYEYSDPNTWYPGDVWRWICMLISNRLGLLSFANLPLVFLYAGRNNLLLWLTNWSHSTFLLLHRWIAAIATLQAILHSLIYLDVYVKTGTHASESQKPYWYWGIIGTLGMTILFPTSMFPIRKKVYELFLTWHVAISILIVAGCYWHIIFEFQHKWGYETWIIICMAIWAFDRIFRVLRLARHGVKTALIEPIDGEYVKVTVPGVSSSGHAYLYFPTLTWRVWENHPFSVASTFVPTTTGSSSAASLTPRKCEDDIEGKAVATSATTTVSLGGGSHASDSPHSSKEHYRAGITFYIRTQSGLTALLQTRRTIPVLIEAGYSSNALISESLHKSATLIGLAGGVGITAVLPHLRSHLGRAQLYWGCRTQALVDDIRGTGALDSVEAEIFVSKRMSIRDVLETELANGPTCETCVLVSGPEEMIDEVRNVVGEIVRRKSGISVRLVVESFCW